MKISIAVLSIVLVLHSALCVSTTGPNNSTQAGHMARATPNNTNSSTNTNNANNSSSNSEEDEENENPLRNMIDCLRADALFKCVNERVGVLIRVWREALLNSVRRNGDQPLPVAVGQGLDNVIKDFGKAIYQGFASFFYGNYSAEDDEARANNESGDSTSSPTQSALEERGHHKKKKVHKEIKKIIIKIIIAIALFILKIKAILGMIQSVIITKFLITALIFLATHTFKIWYEIKQAKLHHNHDKSIIYYDNVHDHHTYDLPEHQAEYDEHGYSPSSSWGSLWGRSYAPTQMPAVTSSSAFQSMYRKPWPYYVTGGKKPASAAAGAGLGTEEEEFS